VFQYWVYTKEYSRDREQTKHGAQSGGGIFLEYVRNCIQNNGVQNKIWKKFLKKIQFFSMRYALIKTCHFYSTKKFHQFLSSYTAIQAARLDRYR
jgi:hypothetical protein